MSGSTSVPPSAANPVSGIDLWSRLVQVRRRQCQTLGDEVLQALTLQGGWDAVSNEAPVNMQPLERLEWLLRYHFSVSIDEKCSPAKRRHSYGVLKELLSKVDQAIADHNVHGAAMRFEMLPRGVGSPSSQGSPRSSSFSRWGPPVAQQRSPSSSNDTAASLNGPVPLFTEAGGENIQNDAQRETVNHSTSAVSTNGRASRQGLLPTTSNIQNHQFSKTALSTSDPGYRTSSQASNGTSQATAASVAGNERTIWPPPESAAGQRESDRRPASAESRSDSLPSKPAKNPTPSPTAPGLATKQPARSVSTQGDSHVSPALDNGGAQSQATSELQHNPKAHSMTAPSGSQSSVSFNSPHFQPPSKQGVSNKEATSQSAQNSTLNRTPYAPTPGSNDVQLSQSSRPSAAATVGAANDQCRYPNPDATTHARPSKPGASTTNSAVENRTLYQTHGASTLPPSARVSPFEPSSANPLSSKPNAVLTNGRASYQAGEDRTRNSTPSSSSTTNFSRNSPLSHSTAPLSLIPSNGVAASQTTNSRSLPPPTNANTAAANVSSQAGGRISSRSASSTGVLSQHMEKPSYSTQQPVSKTIAASTNSGSTYQAMTRNQAQSASTAGSASRAVPPQQHGSASNVAAGGVAGSHAPFSAASLQQKTAPTTASASQETAIRGSNGLFSSAAQSLSTATSGRGFSFVPASQQMTRSTGVTVPQSSPLGLQGGSQGSGSSAAPLKPSQRAEDAKPELSASSSTYQATAFPNTTTSVGDQLNSTARNQTYAANTSSANQIRRNSYENVARHQSNSSVQDAVNSSPRNANNDPRGQSHKVNGSTRPHSQTLQPPPYTPYVRSRPSQNSVVSQQSHPNSNSSRDNHGRSRSKSPTATSAALQTQTRHAREGSTSRSRSRSPTPTLSSVGEPRAIASQAPNREREYASSHVPTALHRSASLPSTVHGSSSSHLSPGTTRRSISIQSESRNSELMDRWAPRSTIGSERPNSLTPSNQPPRRLPSRTLAFPGEYDRSKATALYGGIHPRFDTKVTYSPYEATQRDNDQVLGRLDKWEPFWNVVHHIEIGRTWTVDKVERSKKDSSDAPAMAAEISFTLFENDIRNIRDWGATRVEKNYSQGDYRLLLFMLPVQVNMKKRADTHLWPKGTFLLLDGLPVRLNQRRQQSHDPSSWYGMSDILDLTQHIQQPLSSHKIQMSCVEEAQFYFCLAICFHVTPSTLFMTKPLISLSREEATRRALDFAKPMVCLDSDDEDGSNNGTGKLVFSLVCPISKALMKKPVRGESCTHFQCFDLLTFYESNHRTSGGRWRCASCESFISWRSLQYCGLTAALLQEFEGQASVVRDRVEFQADKKYRLLEENKTRYNKKRQSSIDNENSSSNKRPMFAAAQDAIEID